MAITAALLAFLFVLPAAYAADYTVGDTSGWNQGVDYSTWASSKKFAVGDTILFIYGGLHSVDVVSKSDYDSCTNANALASHTDGSTKIPLAQAGSMYFICPASGHCSGGMKLAITVAGTSNAPSGAAPTTPSASTTTPSGTEPASTDSPPAPSGTEPSFTDSPAANGASGNMNSMVFGACIIFATLVALIMG